MSRDCLVPVACASLALFALLAYGEYRRHLAARRPASLPRPLQTWEGEGGAVPPVGPDEAADGQAPLP